MSDEIPNLILDFELRDESIYIKFSNASNVEALNVKVEFNETILGLHGRKKISSLNVFRKLKYMAPHKEFLIYVDEINSFYRLLEKDIVKVHMEYFNNKRKKFIKIVTHNLSVYKDIPIIIKNQKS